RLVLVPGEPLPRQRLLERVEVALERADIGGAADPDGAARAWAARLFDQPFDRFDRPLWRFAWLQCGAARGYWILCFHHLVADGASVALIGHAVMQACAGRGQAAPSYLDYVEADRAYRASARFER